MARNSLQNQWQIQDLPNSGRQPQRWERQPNILANFPGKLHENEENWTPREREEQIKFKINI